MPSSTAKESDCSRWSTDRFQRAWGVPPSGEFGKMAPRHGSTTGLGEFVDGSRKLAAGWLGLYWGKTMAEYRQSQRDTAASMALDWIEYFVEETPEILDVPRAVDR